MIKLIYVFLNTFFFPLQNTEFFIYLFFSTIIFSNQQTKPFYSKEKMYCIYIKYKINNFNQTSIIFTHSYANLLATSQDSHAFDQDISATMRPVNIYLPKEILSSDWNTSLSLRDCDTLLFVLITKHFWHSLSTDLPTPHSISWAILLTFFEKSSLSEISLTVSRRSDWMSIWRPERTSSSMLVRSS